MKRIFPAILILLFISGALIVPTLHWAYCTDNQNAHEAAKCPICQFAHTAIVTTASAIAPIAGFINLGDAVLPQSFIASSPWRDPTQARAPPAA